MDVIDLLVPTLITTGAIGLSFFDTAFIQAKVHSELPDLIFINDNDYRETLLRHGMVLAELPVLTLIQKEQIKEICRELSRSTGLSRDRREHIVQMCAGAALLVAFVANVVGALATAVFTILAVKSPYQLGVAGVTAIAVLLLGIQMWHIAGRGYLSQIEESHVPLPGMRGDRGPTWGQLLRLELILFNFLLFCELAISI